MWSKKHFRVFLNHCIVGFCNHACFYVLNYPCRSVTKVHDEWFADETRVRKLVGLLEAPVVHVLNAREVRNIDI